MDNEEKNMTIDDANSAALDMFNQDDEAQAEAEYEQAQDDNQQQVQPAENQPDEPIPPTNDDVTQPEQNQNSEQNLIEQLQVMQNQLAEMQRQNGILNDTISQMSDQNKQETVNNVLELPVLDVNSMAFDDEDTIKAKQLEYSQKMFDYCKNQIEHDFKPYFDEAKKGMAEREKTELLDQMKDVKELAGIDQMLPELNTIIETNPLFTDNMDMDKKLITAYIIKNGIDSIQQRQQPQQEPSIDEWLKQYENNRELQNAIEQRRIAAVKENQQVPQMSASNGSGNAALNIKSTPNSLDEANKRARELFEKGLI